MPQITVTINTDTHKVVPIEPTGAMTMYGIHAHERNDDLPDLGMGPKCVGIYKSMLSAASEYKGEQLPEIEGLYDALRAVTVNDEPSWSMLGIQVRGMSGHILTLIKAAKAYLETNTPVAQWQSEPLITAWLEVQFLSGVPKI